MATGGSVFAQSQARNVSPAPQKPGKVKLQEQGSRTASCGPDALDYINSKASAIGADSLFYFELWPTEKTSTAFALNSSATITGAFVFGKVKTGNPGPATMQVSVWNVNSNMVPTTMIPGAVATLNINQATAPDYHYFTFTAPVTVSDSFAIVLQNADATDYFWAVGTDGDPANAALLEGLSYYDYQGFWEPMSDVYSGIGEGILVPVVNYSVTSSFTPSATSVCTGTSVNFTNTSSSLYGNRFFNLHAFDTYFLSQNDSTFSWNFGDGSPVTYGASPSHTFTSPGTYTVTLSGTMLGVLDTCTDIATAIINVTGTPNATAAALNSATSCDGSNVTLEATAVSGAGYQWLFNNSPIGGSTFQQHIAIMDGNYSVIVSNSCGSDTSGVIAVMILDSADVSANTSPVCQGSFVMISATPATNSTYQWYHDDVIINGATAATYNANNGGEYKVAVTNACGTTMDSVMITMYPLPTPAISQNGATLEVDASSVQGGTLIQWFLNGDPIPGETGMTHTPVANGDYHVVATDVNGCTNTSNVIAGITVGVSEDLKSAVTVYPNPASGQLNISFGQIRENVTLSIMNAQGQLMFNSEITTTPSCQVDLSAYSEGVYFLRITSKEQSVLQKIVIRK